MTATQQHQPATLEERYDFLIAQIEQALHAPKKRLWLASELFALAGTEQLDPQRRLNLLYQSVRLDPFEARYRLHLARYIHNLGRFEQAIIEYRRALDQWPESQQIKILLGKALLSAGQVKEARACFEQEPNGPTLKLQVLFGRIECDLREAKERGDWEKILAALKDLPLGPTARGGHASLEARIKLFCEKCLKIVVECGDDQIVEQVSQLAREKIDAAYHGHPAYQTLQQLAQFNPNNCFDTPPPVNGDKLGSLLKSYLLAHKAPIGTGNLDTRLLSLKAWRGLVQHAHADWPGLQDAYLHVVDGWATQAYRQKSFTLASWLWHEAERVMPYNPAILQNLAIVSTRLGHEHACHHYWERVTRTWTLHSEMLPEADGYSKELLQKHQAFVEGAQVKLQQMQTWQELLELGATWITESVSYLALRQLAFRNAFFRCGVTTDDFADDDERISLLTDGYNSMRAWLRLIAEWQGLGDHSALAEWRQAELDAAWDTASSTGKERYQYYDDEKEAFQRQREYMGTQYLMLLFRVVTQLSDEVDLGDATARERFIQVGRALLSFPHQQLKPAVLKKIESLEPDTDPRVLVQNWVAGPWFRHAKQLADEERYQEAHEVLVQARMWSMEGENLREQIESFIDQIDMARVGKQVERVQHLLKRDDWQAAISECQRALAEYPNHPYLLFMLAQAHLIEPNIGQAIAALEQAQQSSRPASELREAIDKNLEDIRQYGPQIILNKAVPKMQEQHWQEAQRLLAKGETLAEPSAQVLFYEAVCWVRMINVAQAESKALAALDACRADETELQESIDSLIDQLPLTLLDKEISSIHGAFQRKAWGDAVKTLENSANKLVQWLPIGRWPRRRHAVLPTGATWSPPAHWFTIIDKYPEAAVLLLFYKALCHFYLDEFDLALGVANYGLPLCTTQEHETFRGQLQELIEAVPQARKAAKRRPIVDALNDEDYTRAQYLINALLREDSTDAELHFFNAICQFRSTMNRINRQSISPSQSLFNPIDQALQQAEYYSGRNADLINQINSLRTNVQTVRNQLRSAGYYY